MALHHAPGRNNILQNDFCKRRADLTCACDEWRAANTELVYCSRLYEIKQVIHPPPCPLPLNFNKATLRGEKKGRAPCWIIYSLCCVWQRSRSYGSKWYFSIDFLSQNTLVKIKFGKKKTKPKRKQMQSASQKRKLEGEIKFVFMKDIDQFDTVVADTQISCHNSSDAEGHAGLSSIKYNLHPEQSDEIWETELWSPTGDTCSWFIFLISYSLTNCAISSWRWAGNNFNS